jgi:hypothetical protein
MTNLLRLIGLQEKYNLPEVTLLVIKYEQIYQGIKNCHKYRLKDDIFHKEISYKILEKNIRLMKRLSHNKGEKLK